jgi:AcrR family transcriptional regulator
VADTSTRADKSAATRTRIAAVALDLFLTNGYTETTVDQIATRAGVGRRTVFRHFPTKGAMLLDHLVLRRDEAMERLRARPASEPPLVSLLAVLRELAEHGYNRRLLAQIRAVLAAQPGLLGEELWAGTDAFAMSVVATLQSRVGDQHSATEVQAVTLMALGWFVSAVNRFLLERAGSLAECFDDVVTLCVEAGSHAVE